MHDAFADTEQIELFAPQDAHSFTYIQCTCWLQQGFTGLPVLDYTARSSTELSEEAYITQAKAAEHMIWDL